MEGKQQTAPGGQRRAGEIELTEVARDLDRRWGGVREYRQRNRELGREQCSEQY